MMRLLGKLFLWSLPVTAGLGISIAGAQPAPITADVPLQVARPPIPLEARPRVVPAPEWAVWRAFHDSLEFYNRQGPERVQSLLVARAGLTDSEVESFQEAGQLYLATLSRIDTEVRSYVNSRFPTPTDAPALVDLPKPSRPFPVPAGRFAQTDVPSLSPYEVLLAEGYVALVERQKEQALIVHRTLLKNWMGPARLAQLEQWIGAEVAPSVKSVAAGQRLSGAPAHAER
jgi:hypothetical protein